MNTSRMNLQKAIGIVNIVAAALVVLSAIFVVIVADLENMYGHTVANLICVSVARFAVGGVMIWLSTKLFAKKSEIEQGQDSRRKGWVIFFLVWGCIGLCNDLHYSYYISFASGGEYMFDILDSILDLLYIATIVLSSIVIHSYRKEEKRKAQEELRKRGAVPPYPYNDPRCMPPQGQPQYPPYQYNPNMQMQNGNFPPQGQPQYPPYQYNPDMQNGEVPPYPYNDPRCKQQGPNPYYGNGQAGQYPYTPPFPQDKQPPRDEMKQTDLSEGDNK